MTDSGLQDRSARESVSRGIIIQAAPQVAPPGGSLPLGQELRLGRGTWEIVAGNLAIGGQTSGLGAGPAFGSPGAADSLWPVGIVILHGSGAAQWSEEILMRPSGMRLTRTGDFLLVRVFLIGGAAILAQHSIVLAASQPIVAASTVTTSTEAIAIQGVATHVIPSGAVRFSVLSSTATMLVFKDAANTIIGQTAPPGFRTESAVPRTAVTAELADPSPIISSIGWELA